MKHISTTVILLTFLIGTAFTTSVSGYQPGSNASDFKLKNIDAKMVSLADYKSAKGFIIVFTCNHCPFAKAYEDRIIALDNKYKTQGYPVIAINPNDSASYPEDSYDEMVKRAKSKKFTFPYLYDQTQEVAKTYGALKTPHIYLLKKEGDKLVVKYTGAIDDNSEDASKVKDKFLENAVDSLIEGKEVAVKTTKAIGCGIKWKK
jgi:peroxiredoxin